MDNFDFKRRCVFIATSYIPGNSVYEYYKALGQEFVKSGCKVIYIFNQTSEDIPRNSESIDYYLWFGRRPTTLKDFLHLRKLIKKYKPTHCISTFGAVNLVTLTSYLCGVENRIVWIRTTQSQILADSKNILRSKFLAIRKSFIYLLSTKIFANSNGTMQESIEVFGINRNKISVLSNLSGKTIFNLKTREERDFSLVIVGRLYKSKGHDALFRQFKIALVKFPSLKLNVIGDGALLDDLKILVSDLNLTESVIFHGNIHPNAIGKVFSQNLIGVSSSLTEAFGWVKIESLKEGTPIISTETEGAKDILQSNLNGEFFNHTDENSLTNAIEKVLSNWDNYSKEAVKSFEENFSIDKVIEKHANRILS